jgi:hypothetical protein
MSGVIPWEEPVPMSFTFMHMHSDAVIIVSGIDLNNAEENLHDLVEDTLGWVSEPEVDKVIYGNMTLIDHNGDGSHWSCVGCEVEFSLSREELIKRGIELPKIK